MRGDQRSDSYVLPASCSEYVHECVNRSGVGVNAQMRPEHPELSDSGARDQRGAHRPLGTEGRCTGN